MENSLLSLVTQKVSNMTEQKDSATTYQTKCVVQSGIDLRKRFFDRARDKVRPIIQYQIVNYIGLDNIDLSDDTVDPDYLHKVYTEKTNVSFTVDDKATELEHNFFIEIIKDILINEFGGIDVTVDNNTVTVTLATTITDNSVDRKYLIDNYNKAIEEFHYQVINLARNLIKNSENSEILSTGTRIVGITRNIIDYYLNSKVGSYILDKMFNECGLKLTYCEDIRTGESHCELTFT